MQALGAHEAGAAGDVERTTTRSHADLGDLGPTSATTPWARGRGCRLVQEGAQYLVQVQIGTTDTVEGCARSHPSVLDSRVGHGVDPESRLPCHVTALTWPTSSSNGDGRAHRSLTAARRARSMPSLPWPTHDRALAPGCKPDAFSGLPADCPRSPRERRRPRIGPAVSESRSVAPRCAATIRGYSLHSRGTSDRTPHRRAIRGRLRSRGDSGASPAGSPLKASGLHPGD